MAGPNDIEMSKGGTATFTCHAVGEPRPKIIWMHEDKEIDMDDNRFKLMDDGSLMIEKIQDDDFGTYECMAKNPDGVAKSRPARMIVNNQNPGKETASTGMSACITLLNYINKN